MANDKVPTEKLTREEAAAELAFLANAHSGVRAKFQGTF